MRCNLKYKHILFDLDGTLTDSGEGIINCVRYALAHFGIEERDQAVLRSFIGPPLFESFSKLYGFPPEKAHDAVAKYRERFREKGMFENHVYDGVPEMLARLQQAGKILGVATAKPLVFTEQILAHFDLRRFFAVVCGTDLTGTSTKAEVIERALAQLGVKACRRGKVAMVGDREHDMDGAIACGVHPIGVSYGYAAEGELHGHGAEMIFGAAQALCAYLLKE